MLLLPFSLSYGGIWRSGSSWVSAWLLRIYLEIFVLSLVAIVTFMERWICLCWSRWWVDVAMECEMLEWVSWESLDCSGIRMERENRWTWGGGTHCTLLYNLSNASPLDGLEVGKILSRRFCLFQTRLYSVWVFVRLQIMVIFDN